MIVRWLAAILVALIATAAPAETIAIVHGRVHTASAAGIVENGTILIADGRIAAVGRDVAIPEGARIIDASGKWITPGLFSAYSQLGLVEVETMPTTNDIAAAGAPFAAGFDVSYGINPASTLIPTVRIGGVTRAATFPLATRSIFAGLGALIHTGTGAEILFRPRAFAFAEMGATGARIAGGARGAAWMTIERALEGGSAENSEAGDADSRALADIAGGAIPLILHVERAPDILQALSLKQRHPRLRLVLLGASEAWVVASQIAEAQVPVIIDSYANMPSDFETMGATQENAARLDSAGVTIAIAPLYRFNAAAPHDARLVTQFAGNAVANGLPWDSALRAVTINPARIFGVEDRLGSIERGKVADLVVWDSDPLELGSEPDLVLIAGVEAPLVSRQTRLFERYRNLSDPVPFGQRPRGR